MLLEIVAGRTSWRYLSWGIGRVYRVGLTMSE